MVYLLVIFSQGIASKNRLEFDPNTLINDNRRFNIDMHTNSYQSILSILIALLIITPGCSAVIITPTEQLPELRVTLTNTPQVIPDKSKSTAAPTPTPSSTSSPTPTITATPFPFGEELTISHLREMEINGSEINIEEKLSPGTSYQRYLASFLSEGYKIYGLLTVPDGDPPEGGFKAIVFNHGYIPPDVYRTEERYEAYVNYLARSGFVVFKIDYRGHGQSEGYPSGAYFSPGYTIDAISALKSLQRLDYVNPDGIGMWGHSMAGNLVLRAMLVEPDIKAGVIWAGAIYSYEDFTNYGINDTSYRPPATPEDAPETEFLSASRIIFETYGWPDLDNPYWKAVSLTENISFLTSPIQIHHAQIDPVVTIRYSYRLVEKLQLENKTYEFYIYDGGGHNLVSPYFDQAMLRTVQFFEDNL
jgi:fermentation-respiration switch protein FrsA (DUF1100 family)